MARHWKPTDMQKELGLLYGIDFTKDPKEWNVKFGARYVPLRNQTDTIPSPDGRYYAMTERIRNHLGLLQDVYNDPEYYAMLKARPSELQRRERSADLDLEQKVLAPMRPQMERLYQFSLYRSGSIKYVPDEKTGLVTIAALGSSMIKVLPLSVEVARMYGLDDVDIRLIAPEAIYVLEKKKLAHGVLRTETKLLAWADGWMPYIPDIKVRKRLYQSFKDMTPCIVGKRVKQLMLPGT